MIRGISRGAAVKIALAISLALTLSLLAGCGGGGGGGGGVGGGGGGVGTLTGFVVDESGNVGVNQATVTCAGVTTFTGPDGKFILLNVAAGTHTMYVTPRNTDPYVSGNKTVTVYANTSSSIGNFVLQDSGPPGPPPPG
jgi:hypothetical protein